MASRISLSCLLNWVFATGQWRNQAGWAPEQLGQRSLVFFLSTGHSSGVGGISTSALPSADSTRANYVSQKTPPYHSQLASKSNSSIRASLISPINFSSRKGRAEGSNVSEPMAVEALPWVYCVINYMYGSASQNFPTDISPQRGTALAASRLSAAMYDQRRVSPGPTRPPCRNT